MIGADESPPQCRPIWVKGTKMSIAPLEGSLQREFLIAGAEYLL